MTLHAPIFLFLLLTPTVLSKHMEHSPGAADNWQCVCQLQIALSATPCTLPLSKNAAILWASCIQFTILYLGFLKMHFLGFWPAISISRIKILNNLTPTCVLYALPISPLLIYPPLYYSLDINPWKYTVRYYQYVVPLPSVQRISSHIRVTNEKLIPVLSMKAYGGVELELHWFITSTACEGKCSAWRQVASPGAVSKLVLTELQFHGSYSRQLATVQPISK